MDMHSSESAKPSRTNGGYSLDSITIVSELCSAVMALQKAAVEDCPETFSDSNAQVRLYVQRLLEIKSESQTYIKLREAVLHLLEAALGESTNTLEQSRATSTLCLIERSAMKKLIRPYSPS